MAQGTLEAHKLHTPGKLQQAGYSMTLPRPPALEADTAGGGGDLIGPLPATW